MERTVIIIAFLLFLCSSIVLFAGDGGHYFTYGDLTVWVDRESEFGVHDTIKFEHVISKTIRDNLIELYIVEPYRHIVILKEPKERIINEQGY